MASQLRARSRTSSYNAVAVRNADRPPLPFNSTVREFMSTARQCQTLIAVGEGQFNQRVLPELEKNVLQRFVGLAIYGDKDRIPTVENKNTGFSLEELKCIDRIVSEVVDQNKKFDKYRRKKGEIHYGACYVFGYEYNKTGDKMFRMPLFKVYRDIHDNDVIYIDENLKVYDNWEHFLDANYLPLSFICVPKDGLYSISNDKAVQLDFFCMSGIYWTTGRIIKTVVKSTILVGSIVLAVYSGPIGGVVFSTLTRLGLCAQAIWNGYDIAKIVFRGDCRNSLRRYEDKQTISLLLNVTSDILISLGPTSVAAQIVAGLLSGFSVYQSGDIIRCLVLEGYQKYKKTGTVPLDNALNVANALLLFCNASVQFSTAAGFLACYVSSKASPLFPTLPSNGGMAVPALNIIVETFKFANSKAGDFVRKFLGDVWSFLRGKKPWADFKEDAKTFFYDLGNEMVEYTDSLLKEYIYMKTKINASALFRGNIIKTGYQVVLSSYDYLKFLLSKKKLDEINNLEGALKNVFSDSEKAKGILKSIDEKIHVLTEQYLEKVDFELNELDLMDIEKVVKAEVLIKSRITREITKRLNISVKKMSDIKKLDPEVLKDISDQIIEDMTNKLNDPEVIEEFKSEWLKNQRLILVGRDENTEVHVFKKEERMIDFDSYLEELGYDTNSYDLQKIEGSSYIFKFNGISDQVIFFTDETNPEDVLCYIIIVK